MIHLRDIADKRFFLLIPISSAVVLIISLFMLYTAINTPIDSVAITPMATYVESASFDYTATLRPNLIYGKTILSPGEGTLYTKITEEIRLTFTQDITGSPIPENVTQEIMWDIKIGSNEGWVKIFPESEAINLFEIHKGTTTTLKVNVTDVIKYANLIMDEAGFLPTPFNLTITPRIIQSLKIFDKSIQTTYAPTLDVEFINGNKNGDYITINPLTQSEERVITETTTTHNDTVLSQRMAWSIGAFLSLTILLGSSYLKIKSPRKNNEIDKLLSSYKELIIKNTTPPGKKGNINLLQSFEDSCKGFRTYLKTNFYA